MTAAGAFSAMISARFCISRFLYPFVAVPYSPASVGRVCTTRNPASSNSACNRRETERLMSLSFVPVLRPTTPPSIPP